MRIKDPCRSSTAAKRVFPAADLPEARRRLDEFGEHFAKTAPKAVACLEAGFDDAMVVMALPEKSRKRLRTTNRLERLNEEIRRRERVIRIFPNDESALRLFGALLAEQNQVWQERVYLDMQEYHDGRRRASPPERATTLLPSPAENQSSLTDSMQIYSRFRA